MDPFGIFLGILLSILSLVVVGALLAEIVPGIRNDIRQARELDRLRRRDES
jgi:hypothetical protein